MDYGFAPGGTGFDLLVAKYIRLRPHTVLLKPATNDVAAFVKMVNSDGSVQRPVGPLSIGCHGHSYGTLQIQLDSSSGTLSTIDDVTRVEASHALELAPTTLFPPPLDPVTHVPALPTFRIIGCSIGAARPFVTHLRQALGPIVVVATRHEDAEAALKIENVTSGVTVSGVLRFLVYEFRVNSLLPLQKSADVVDAFKNKHPTFVDGKPIPLLFWTARVPPNVLKLGTTKDAANLTFNPTINGVPSMPLESERWEHLSESVGPWGVTLPAVIPKTATERREFMRVQIKTKPEFAASHPFPLHQQRGFATYDAFIDGHDWLSPPGSPNFWSGNRHVYRVGAAVTLPSDGNELPYDWVDTTNTATHFGLSEFDDRLFVRIL
jgi:hypothetical protein